MSRTLEIPVYKSKNYEYVRVKDLPEDYNILELNQFMDGKTQPLLQGENGTINDAIFLHDWLEFKEYLAGKRARLDETTSI